MIRGLLCLLALLAATAAHAQCDPATHAADDEQALNRFWGLQVRVCKMETPRGNAYADRPEHIVWADQDWLDHMAQRFGSWAATGILAHEWGHMLQGEIQGTAAELQADCYAGVYMRGVGLPWDDVAEFANANLLASDPKWRADGHGTSIERWSAARHGYVGYAGQDRQGLLALCPLSAT